MHKYPAGSAKVGVNYMGLKLGCQHSTAHPRRCKNIITTHRVGAYTVRDQREMVLLWESRESIEISYH